MASKNPRKPFPPGWLALLLYFLAVTVPSAAVVLLNFGQGGNVLHHLGLAAPLVGASMLFMQPVLSARLKFVERPVGLDVVFLFHRFAAIFGFALVAIHPVLIAASGSHWELLYSLDFPWYIILGKANLVVLFVLIVVSLWWKNFGLKFDTWRLLHNVLGVLLLAGVFVHAITVGDDLETPGGRIIWIAFFAGSVGFYVYHKLAGPYYRKKNAYTVAEVKKETHDARSIYFKPPENREVPEYYPGQFHFMTFYGKKVPREEHPFTISSSPTMKGVLASTPKESGDFTSKLGDLEVGDRIAVQGPYGRFSTELYPESDVHVFIAGGIGVTPFVSMLRYLRDEKRTDKVFMFYANKTEKDVAFREEVETIAEGEHPRLRVIHVLEDPPGEWEGEKGYLNVETIGRHAGEDYISYPHYVCGPPPMAKKIIDALLKEGVPGGRIYYEKFAL